MAPLSSAEIPPDPPEWSWPDDDLARLPSCVAILLRDIGVEPDARVRLQRVCDVTEMLLRLCVFLRIAEWDGSLPDDLARKVVGRAERPTFGDWLYLACDVSDAPRADTLVPELNWSVNDVLYPLVTALKRGENRRRVDPTDSVMDARNALAHGGGLSHRAAGELLHCHVPRLEKAMAKLAWLRELRLVARDLEGAPKLLSGPSGVGCDLREDDIGDVAAWLRPGQVVAVRGARSVPLYPLHAFGRPEVIGADPWRRADDPAPLVFFRGQDRWLELAALDSLWSTSELRGDAVRRFRDLFRIGERRTLLREESGGFDRDMSEEARRLIGRDRELEQVLTIVDATASGVLWLHGVAGVGKSALLSGVFTHLVTRDRPNELVVAYRFRADDPRATRLQFLRWAIRGLERWPASEAGITSSHIYDDAEKLEARTGQLLRRVDAPNRVVFVLDGLDEIARADPGFTDVIARLAARQTSIVWLCGGRFEDHLQEPFAPGRCIHVFPGDGLGRLDDLAVAEWLIRDAPMTVRDRLIRDSRDGQLAAWVGHVVQRSNGLPAYLTLLLDDLRVDDVRVGEPLPRGLPEYFSKLLQRNQNHDVAGAAPVTFAAIALAADPPDETVLVEVLRGCGQLPEATAADHPAIVAGAVARARTMLRQVSLDTESGYAPYHEELAAFLKLTPQLVNERARARIGWQAFAEGACGLPNPVRKRACRTAVRQLIALGDLEAAERWVYAPELLTARLDAGQHNVLADLVRESQLISANLGHLPRLAAWSGFLATYERWLMVSGAATFVQLALSHADQSIVTQETEQWIATSGSPFPWFRRVGRSPTEAQLGALRTPDRHDGAVRHCRAAGALVASAGDDTFVKLWDPETGRLVRVLNAHSDRVTALWSDVTGGTIVSGSADGEVVVWDTVSGLPMSTQNLPGPGAPGSANEQDVEDQPRADDQVRYERTVTDISWTPDGRLVTAEASGALRVWDASGHLELTIGIPWAAGEDPRAHLGSIATSRVMPDGRRIVSSGADFRSRVWSLETGALELDVEGAPSGPDSLAVTRDGMWLVIGAGDGMRVWKTTTDAPVWCLDDSMGAIRVVLAVSTSHVVFGGEDGVVQLWNVAQGESLWEGLGAAGPILCLAFDEEHQRLAAGTGDGSLIVWEPGVAQPIARWLAEDAVTVVSFAASGRRLLYGDAAGNVITLDLMTADTVAPQP